MRAFVSFIFLSLSFLIIPSVDAVENTTGSQGTYRLSGLVVTTEGRNLALIELPDGNQIMLREGDIIDGKIEVLEINRGLLRLRFPDGDKVLDLGAYKSSSVAEYKDVFAVQIVQKKEDSADGAIMSREVAVDALLSVFKKQSSVIAEGKDLSTYLAPMLDLPPKSRIMSVNHAPVNSVKEAFKAISEQIADGNVVSLTLDGNERVYLMPSVQP